MKKSRVSANIIMTIVIIWLLIPLLATIIYSLFEKWTGIVPEGFTLNAYRTIFTNKDFLTSMYQTLLVCVVPIVITILVVLLGLFAVTVYFPKLEKYVQLLCMIPYTIQGVILSVSILTGDSGWADALSTAVFNMPLEEGLDYVNHLGSAAACWILADGEIVYSDEFKAYILP